MRTPDIYLGALGVHLPDRVDIEDVIAEGRCDPDQSAVHGLTGALVAEDVPAVELAVRAGRDAMRQYKWTGEEFDAFIHVDVFNQGLELWHPGAYIARRLDARPVPAYELRQACTGLLAAFELAVGQFAADPTRQSVMITSADNFSHPGTDRWRMCPGFVFGDAGSAVVLTRRPGFARLRAVNTVTLSALEQMHRGVEPMYPPARPLDLPVDLLRRMVEFRMNGGEEVANGRELMTKAQDELIRRTLDEAGIDLSEVARVAFTHMSGKGTEERIMEPLGLPMSASTFEIGRSIGHAGASDPLIDLDQLLLRGELAAGDHVLIFGLGAGITMGAAVVEILDPAAHLPVPAGPRG